MGAFNAPPPPSKWRVNPRPAGGDTPHCTLLNIAQKRKGIELRNFQNPFLHQLRTFWLKKNFTPMIGQPWVTSQWRHVLLFQLIRICGNRCHTLILKIKTIRRKLVWSETNGLQNRSLGFLKVWKFRKFLFSPCFLFLQKKNPQISKFSKKWDICGRRTSKECMYQVSSNSLHKGCFYSILNVKKAYFSGHLDVIPTMQFHILILFRFLCTKWCSRVIFSRSRRNTDP